MRLYLTMRLYREKVHRFTFTHFLAILLCVMFILTAILSFKLLTITNDNCNNCPKTAQQQHVQYITKPIASNHHQRGGFESAHRLAVLVPHRDRFEELMEFVPYLHDFLNEQKIDHDIFVLNQVDAYRFNRASLINVGYLETKSNYDYIAMHDVDLLPLNKNLSYKYPVQPFHLAAPTLHPRYHYNKFIGGILLINREHFNLVDGLSNKYWGWGLEDDEFYVRLRDASLNVTRPVNIATGIGDTFRHIHGKQRKRDTIKCHNQREVTRKRDRQTGLHDVQYRIAGYKTMTIAGAPLTVVNIRLICDVDLTPWCDCSDKKTSKGASTTTSGSGGRNNSNRGAGTKT